MFLAFLYLEFQLYLMTLQLSLFSGYLSDLNSGFYLQVNKYL